MVILSDCSAYMHLLTYLYKSYPTTSMKVLRILPLVCVVAWGCSNKSDSAKPSVYGTDAGHGIITYGGRSVYVSGYAVVPSAAGLSMAGTGIYDTLELDLSVNLAPNPSRSDTAQIGPSSGNNVILIEASTKTRGVARTHYFFSPGDPIYYYHEDGKRRIVLDNLLETDVSGATLPGGVQLSATLKQ